MNVAILHGGVRKTPRHENEAPTRRGNVNHPYDQASNGDFHSHSITKGTFSNEREIPSYHSLGSRNQISEGFLIRGWEYHITERNKNHTSLVGPNGIEDMQTMGNLRCQNQIPQHSDRTKQSMVLAPRECHPRGLTWPGRVSDLGISTENFSEANVSASFGGPSSKFNFDLSSRKDA
ncbi:hypothetical protein HYALB_00008653 [Hymenoscyphus albidus]|uniref:Uncharacterized protein n=1 Tax=Hymenoscyphus albidus TaxID=595503 RepID=A0A9N9Q2U5_9HELO|nr:hypothetical protein HYALB_00008653 [Hymenoscyphus albidus]